ncbi:MAG: LysM peptidoglycan-binding domain-containing protein [Bdellovibrionales bacterium]|nr:LysM peptidoglycan-binding domain-containing protein [Bdellovibrionales bacterium]
MFMKLVTAAFLITPCLAWSQTEYTVREGDTLLKIADRSLGSTDKKDPRRYEYAKNLVKLNPKLKNPNALVPGQTILLPGDAPSMKEAAVKETAPANEKVGSLKPVAAAAAVIAAKPEPHVAAPAAPAAPLPAPSPSAEVKPEAAAKEAPEKKEEHAKEAHSAEAAHHNFIFVQPRYQSVKLTSEDEANHTEATMKSNSSVGFDLQYGKIINERWHLLFQAGLTSTRFGEIEDGAGTNVGHKSETLKSFGVGVAYEATPSLHVDLMALYTEQSFLLPEATLGEYRLEAIAFPGVELNISWDIYSGARNIVGLSVIGEYLGNATKDGVEYKSALEPYGALYWKSNLGADRVNYKVTLTYKHGHQETSVNKKKEDVGTVGVGFYF